MSNALVGSTSKIKKGAFLSFLAIIFEVIVNFFLLRFLTKNLGSDYGLYTLALNTISIFLVDFGLGQSVVKFISKYRISDDKEGENRFLGLILKIYIFLDIFVIIACTLVFLFIPYIYGGLNATEQNNFKIVFIIVGIYSCVSFPLLPLNGILQGHEEFSTIKILSMLQKLLCTVLLALCLFLDLGLYSVVFVNVFSALIISIIKIFIVVKKCKVIPSFRQTDKKLLKEILSFTLWIAISSLASRISLSIMPTILATIQNSTIVSVFGIVITLETYAYMFSTAISGLFLPKITNIAENNDNKNLNSLSAIVGKFQMIISGTITVGFIVFGREFLSLYLEPFYGQAYLPTIFLFFCVMIQSTLLIPQTTSFAMGTIKYVSLIELIFSIIRLCLCWFFGWVFGINGLSLCYLIMEVLMNLFKIIFVFYKKQNLDLKNFVTNVFLKSIPAFIASLIIGFLIKKGFYSHNWTPLILCCIALGVVIILIMFLFYLNSIERKKIFDTLFVKIPLFNCLAKQFSQSKKENHFVPTIFGFLIIWLSMFCSNYPITNVALAALLVVFFILLILYFYFCISDKFRKGTWFKDKIFIRNISIWFIILFSIFTLISFIQTKSFGSVLGISKGLIILWSAFFFVEIFSFRTFYKFFRKVFTIICCISLMMSVIIFLNGGDFSHIIENGTYYNYFYVFFSMVRTPIAVRNCAVFWEPGIFASFCCIAITLEILYNKDKWYKQIFFYLIYFISLLSTGSLAGYILLIVILPLFLNKINSKITKYISWILVLSVIFGIILFIPMFDTIVKMFPVIESKGASLTTRIYALFVDLEIFSKNPLFGVGYEYNSLFMSIVNQKYYGLLDTSLNTFGYYLGAFGFAGILFMFIYSISFSKRFDILTKINLLILGILIFSKEPHTLSLLSMIFVFYLLKSSDPLINYDNEDNSRMEKKIYE